MLSWTQPVRPRRAQVAAIGLATFLPGAASFGFARDRGSEPPRRTVNCSRDVCFVTVAIDTDGDGVSDTDEIAAGTDPGHPGSRPGARLLLELVRRQALPSFQEGRTTVVVLPTAAPDGTALYGGKDGLPARRDAPRAPRDRL